MIPENIEPEDLLEIARYRLDENPDAPLVDRVAWGIVIAASGYTERAAEVSIGELARILEEPPGAIYASLIVNEERAAMSGNGSGGG